MYGTARNGIFGTNLFTLNKSVSTIFPASLIFGHRTGELLTYAYRSQAWTPYTPTGTTVSGCVQRPSARVALLFQHIDVKGQVPLFS
jgi:hypothetical protein